MIKEYTVQFLKDFESSIAEEYNAGHIRAPIHLAGGNEQQLLDIFNHAKIGDYFFCSWRNHLHALLAGIPPEEVRRQIMAGRSMTVCSPEHRFFSSAIVAGCCPIALGVAWQIKRNGGKERVWLFLGDMAIMTGIAVECINYARWNNLPLIVVLEDNNKSVCGDTREIWGLQPEQDVLYADYHYKFTLPYPHAGAGRRIQF